MNIGKNRFLLTTAVLLAGVSLASVQGSAQGMREGAGGVLAAVPPAAWVAAPAAVLRNAPAGRCRTVQAVRPTAKA